MSDETNPVTGVTAAEIAAAVEAIIASFATLPAGGTQKYLVFSLGLDQDKDGKIDPGKGGKLLSLPLPPYVDTIMESLLPLLGVKDECVSVEGALTIPAFRVKVLGVVVKGKPIDDEVEAIAQIVDAATEAAMPSAIHVSL